MWAYLTQTITVNVFHVFQCCCCPRSVLLPTFQRLLLENEKKLLQLTLVVVYLLDLLSKAPLPCLRFCNIYLRCCWLFSVCFEKQEDNVIAFT